MNAIKYYRVAAVVRSDDDSGSEGVMSASAHARDEQSLKRLLLERIWHSDRLLSRWLKITEGVDDDD